MIFRLIYFHLSCNKKKQEIKSKPKNSVNVCDSVKMYMCYLTASVNFVPNSGNDIAEIAEQLQQLQATQRYSVDFLEPEAEPEPEPEPEPVEVITPPSPPPKTHTPTPPTVRSPDRAESIIGDNRKPPAFQLSKQHTGMKNRSFGVGMAVMPSSKMEFNQQEREDFGIVKINRPFGNEVTSPGQDNTDAMSTVSSTGGLTDQGYNDLKFYHNKLW